MLVCVTENDIEDALLVNCPKLRKKIKEGLKASAQAKRLERVTNDTSQALTTSEDISILAKADSII